MKSLLLVSLLSTTAEAVETQISEVGLFFPEGRKLRENSLLF